LHLGEIASDVPVPGPVIRFAMTTIAAGIKRSRH
jgi:hypothetical protein